MPKKRNSEITWYKTCTTTILIAAVMLNFSFAQVDIQVVSRFDTVFSKKLDVNEIRKNSSVFLQMNFGQSEILNPGDIKGIKQRKIEKVQLICTDYPNLEASEKLNRKRLLTLYMIAPQMFNNNTITWEIVIQTGVNKTNRYLFPHGFAIILKQEGDSRKNNAGYQFFDKVFLTKKTPADSTIFNVFERNKEWDDMLIVCDMTESMTPYIAEVLLWYNLNFNNKKNQIFSFFNDGNTTPDDKKRIGKTGGIYFCDKKNIDSVLHTAILTMEKGTGGDGPENDVEALISSMRKYPEKNNIVLIADNQSTMRDYSLIARLNKPVRIILCGLTERLNSEYLDLARKTGGSIHTIETDIVNLVRYKEGETVQIGQEMYKIINGRFVLSE